LKSKQEVAKDIVDFIVKKIENGKRN
jgi:hypothetical protein